MEFNFLKSDKESIKPSSSINKTLSKSLNIYSLTKNKFISKYISHNRINSKSLQKKTNLKKETIQYCSDLISNYKTLLSSNINKLENLYTVIEYLDVDIIKLRISEGFIIIYLSEKIFIKIEINQLENYIKIENKDFFINLLESTENTDNLLDFIKFNDYIYLELNFNNKFITFTIKNDNLTAKLNNLNKYLEFKTIENKNLKIELKKNGRKNVNFEEDSNLFEIIKLDYFELNYLIEKYYDEICLNIFLWNTDKKIKEISYIDNVYYVIYDFNDVEIVVV